MVTEGKKISNEERTDIKWNRGALMERQVVKVEYSRAIIAMPILLTPSVQINRKRQTLNLAETLHG